MQEMQDITIVYDQLSKYSVRATQLSDWAINWFKWPQVFNGISGVISLSGRQTNQYF